MKAQLDLSKENKATEGQQSSFRTRGLPLVLAVIAAIMQGVFFARCASGGSGRAYEDFSRIAVSRGMKRGQPVSLKDVTFSLQVNLAESKFSEMFYRESESGELEGLFLVHDLPEGTPLTRAHTSHSPVLPLDVEGIPPGRVLFPLSVKLGALARLLSPGQRVDVLAHMTLPDVGAVTETLLEAIPLVGIGENQDAQGVARGDVVTFHLRPEEMKLLVHAQKFSEFHLALRNPKEIAASGKDAAMTLNRFLANPRIQKALSSDVFRIRSGSLSGESQSHGE